MATNTKNMNAQNIYVYISPLNNLMQRDVILFRRPLTALYPLFHSVLTQSLFMSDENYSTVLFFFFFSRAFNTNESYKTNQNWSRSMFHLANYTQIYACVQSMCALFLVWQSKLFSDSINLAAPENKPTIHKFRMNGFFPNNLLMCFI